MDVEDLAPPFADEIVGEQAHVTGKGDGLDAGLAKRGVDRGFVFGLGDTLGRVSEGRDALLVRPGEAGGFGLIAGDEGDFVSGV